MNKSKLYSSILVATLVVSSAFYSQINAAAAAADEDLGEGSSKDFAKNGMHGKHKKHKRKSAEINEAKLRPEIKNLWDRYKELCEFKKSLIIDKMPDKKAKLSRKQKDDLKKARKENKKKVLRKIAALNLTLSACDNFRKLKNLEIHERLVLNKIESYLIKRALIADRIIQFRRAKKAKDDGIESEDDVRVVHEEPLLDVNGKPMLDVNGKRLFEDDSE
ncbi:MAG: hypothetical protein US49_C0006G0007 [candidate division TM6 bacterium GW2011_GWF2_37_49]|nr:MAG: hypothetical protein US49_C0006G0007 [candidate division TM6 bacterium GW2011_GWF2_37_49]